MQSDDHVIEERLGVIILEGQRQEVWVRSEADVDGTWHNALVFRRDGKLSTSEDVKAGLDWHLPPGVALEQARSLGETEQVELFRKALRPRPPLM
ncbi:MAG TPA: hypothetical protein VMK65_10280 [Longimicrobiales bacterium]|nr:hypothetical protein [Longimicrobiales bacterium]